MTDETDNGVEEREPFDIRDPSESRKPVVDDHSDPGTDEPVDADEHSGDDDKSGGEESKAEPIEFGDLDDYIDSDLAKAVKGLFEKMSGEIQTLREQVKNQPTAASQGRVDRTSSMFAGHEELFGSDAPSPAQTKNRERIREQMDILKAGYKSAGKKTPSTQELFDKVLRSEFSDEVLKQERSQFVNKVRNREQQIISRPSARTGDSTSARQRAEQAVQQRMRELGL